MSSLPVGVESPTHYFRFATMNYLKINVSFEIPMALDSTPSELTTRLGSYLIEAGLITPAQVTVVLNDQTVSHDMRFGEVLVARGWVKQETIEFIMKRVVEPERQARVREAQNQNSSPSVPPLQPSKGGIRSQTNNSQAQRHSSQGKNNAPVPPPIPNPPPRSTTPPQPIVARARSLDGDFEFEILDDLTLGLPNSQPVSGILNDRKPLPSVPDESGVNWAG